MSIVIVGAGHAGFQAAASLRQDGYAEAITLVDSQQALPYQRPPLSKAYLKGEMSLQALGFRRGEFFEEHAIQRVTSEASGIDAAAHRLLMGDGRAIGYEHLILAPGARNRPLAVPGCKGLGVAGIRTLADADLLREQLHVAGRVVVIGAGFIGLEFAAVAAAAGKQVDVIELAPLPMGRALTPRMARFFMDHHVASGIRFHAGCGVTSIARDANGDVCGVNLTNRKVLAADLIVFGIGVIPNIELAHTAGLACDNGIRVDGDLLTTDPHISAIGDAANFPGPAGRLRLESVQNAVDQARHVSARIVSGRRTPYVAVPWFWSDQGALRLQIAGLSAGFDESQIVGDPQAGKFSVLCFARRRLVCVESVNSPGDHMAARKLLALPQRPCPEEARAAGFSLKSWSPLDSRATAAVRTAPVSCRTDS